MPESEPFPLTTEQVRQIWTEWQDRPTIQSLARRYHTNAAMIRLIIALRKEDLPS